jgi:hypothetical protein
MRKAALSCIIVMHNFACVKSGHFEIFNTRFYGHYVFFQNAHLYFVCFFPVIPRDTLWVSRGETFLKIQWVCFTRINFAYYFHEKVSKSPWHLHRWVENVLDHG